MSNRRRIDDTSTTRSEQTEANDTLLWVRVAGLFGVLLVAWVLWSWLFKPLVVGLGIASCLLVVYLTNRMEYFRSEHYALRFNLRLPLYWIWLTKEMFKSSFAVARVIIDPRLPISPRTIDVEAPEPEPNSQTIFANSITLTPGSLALDVHEGVIKVHTLTQQAADDLMSGAMARRVCALRKK